MAFYLLINSILAAISAFFHRLPFLPWYISYSDVFKFFRVAHLPGWPYINISIEYPVLTGLFVRGAGVLAGEHKETYYYLSSFFLIVCALAVTFLLYRMSVPQERKRLWVYWICAPTLFVFLLVNWDILAVLASVAALYCAGGKRFIAAAALLALGFSAKFYPIIYMIPLIIALDLWRERIKVAGAFLGVAALINAPFAILNFSGWFHFFQFNSLREPNFDSIWTLLRLVIPEISVAWINALSLMLFAAIAILFLKKIRRAPILISFFAITLIFMLSSKVFSPQYILWLLPFFVLSSIPTKKIFYTLEAVNIFVFFVILKWLDSVTGGPFIPNKYFYLAMWLVAARHTLLAYILFKVNTVLKNPLRFQTQKIRSA